MKSLNFNSNNNLKRERSRFAQSFSSFYSEGPLHVLFYGDIFTCYEH